MASGKDAWWPRGREREYGRDQENELFGIDSGMANLMPKSKKKIKEPDFS
jgi:hypothetical protein